jgi:hypothetical protein
MGIDIGAMLRTNKYLTRGQAAHALERWARESCMTRVAVGRVKTRGSSVFTHSWHGAGPFLKNYPFFGAGRFLIFKRTRGAVPFLRTRPDPGITRRTRGSST